LKLKLAVGTLAVGFLVASSSPGLMAQTPPPDNTKTNQRDRSKTEKTADQAKNKQVDLDLMQKIRKSLTEDKALSTYAHNVKVISENGKVTLKGPVRSEEEKKTVEQRATDIAGAGNVTSQLTIKPEKKS